MGKKTQRENPLYKGSTEDIAFHWRDIDGFFFMLHFGISFKPLEEIHIFNTNWRAHIELMDQVGTGGSDKMYTDLDLKFNL